MPLPKELTTVTSLSKGLALSMFIFIPFITYLVGFNLGYQTDNTARNRNPEPTVQKNQTSQKNNDQIELSVKNPFAENKATRYLITHKNAGTDTVKILLNTADFSDKQLEITRGRATLIITPVFEDGLTTFEQKPDIHYLPMSGIIKKQLTRIKSLSAYNYIYTNSYAEGAGCKQVTPLPVACMMGSIQLGNNKSVVITCNASLTDVSICDNLVNSLDIQ